MANSRLTKSVIDAQLQKSMGKGSKLAESVSNFASFGVDQMKGLASDASLKVIDAAKNGVTDSLTGATAGLEGVSLDTTFEEMLSDLQESLKNLPVLGKTANQLKRYATYNYNITLACLTVNEINFPDSTYRISPPQVTVLRSGGGAPGKALTAYESSDAQLEYYIDNLVMNSVIAPTSKTRTSNATVQTFTVHEPYSMGLFLQTLMIAANKAGHADYLKAPYALIIEFKGYDDNGQILDTGSTTRRIFPIKIAKMDFDVNGSGSSYNIRSHAWNESALTMVSQYTKTDTIITGDSVQELLQGGPESLTGIINRRNREEAEKLNAINKDEYFIMFPPQLVSSLGLGNKADTPGENAASMKEIEFYKKLTGGTFDTLLDYEETAASDSVENYINLQPGNNNLSAVIKRIADNKDISNKIGKGTIARSMATGGAVPFGREAFSNDPDTDVFNSDRVTISNSFRTFSFPQSTSIEQIIEEIVILSTYAKDAAVEVKADADGMVDWFRVHTQTFLVPDEEVRSKTGENPKVFVYAVVPYKVHSSVFSNVTQPSVGIEKRVAQAAKEYNYIYTGKNDDVIDFEINFNTSFFTALSPNYNGSGDSKNATKDSTNNPGNPHIAAKEGSQGNNSSTGSKSLKEDPTAKNTGTGGGNTLDTPEVQIARSFNEAIVNNQTDLVSMDLTVLGDPYYLADSGQGNYSSPTLTKAYTADGTMDYQNSEVEVVVNFRTPIDYNRTDGSMIFPEDTVPVKSFSGLYKVNTVENKFEGGKFTQVLSLIRRNNQESDIGIPGTPDNTSALETTDKKDKVEDKNNPTAVTKTDTAPASTVSEGAR